MSETITTSMNGAGPYKLALTVSNTGWNLKITRSGSYPGSYQNGASWAVTIDGQKYSGSFDFNFSSSGSINFTVANASRTTYGSVAVSASVDTSTSAVGDGSLSGTMQLGGILHLYVNGTWRDVVPYMFVNGTWVQVTPYIYVNDTWRIGV